MGYHGDLLKANCLEENIQARRAETLMVEQSCEHQEAIAVANTARKKYYTTRGGKHSTTDDGFIALEMNLRTCQVSELERGKKSRTVYHMRHDATIPILDCIKYKLKGTHTKLCGKELEVLLKWKGVAASKMKTVIDKCTLFQKFADNGVIGFEDESSIWARGADANRTH